MSHMITMTNGKAEMAYLGETPWHKLGSEMQAGASIDQWLTAAGMGWQVKRSRVRFVTEQGGEAAHTWEDQHVLFRSDTKAPLGLVSKHFKIVQPKQVLEFFRDLCETNRFTMQTAGTLRGGAVYWALASIGETAFVGKGDEMHGHVLLSTACDGTRKTSAKNTTTRVVCANTLAMADSEGGRREVVVSHRSQFNPDEVKTDLGIARSAFEQFMDHARHLSKRKLSPAEVTELQVQLFGKADVQGEERLACLDTKHAQAVLSLFHGGARGADLVTSKGTAWGYVNAVSEYVDHHFPSKSDENRLNSAWFGFGERLKNNALSQALAITE